MKRGQRPVALIAACVLLFCLCACQKKQLDTDHTENHLNNSVNTEASTSPSESTQQRKFPSSDDLIAYIRGHGRRNGYGSDFMSVAKTEAGESAGEKKISFTYYKGYASASITEIDNIAQTIVVTALPAKFAQLTPSNSSTENLHQAYAVCLVMLEACESDKDGDWHVEQLRNAQDEGNSSVSIGSYTSDKWHYTGMLSDYYVTCVAARYCSQCGNNAPAVIFFSGTAICDKCNSNAQEGTDATTDTPLAPEVSATEPVVKVPMNDVPYTTSLEAAVSIFDGPSYDYTYVQSVGQDGIYTIVEEAYDAEGNLWGRLKSGVGWVELSKATSQPQSESPISANFAPDSVLNSDHHEAILDHSEYMVKVAFWAHENLSNVQFSFLQFEGNSYQVAEVLYTLPELTPDKPLVTGISFPGPASIFGISFTDSSGATRCYAVFTSGRNGELVLEEYS